MTPMPDEPDLERAEAMVRADAQRVLAVLGPIPPALAMAVLGTAATIVLDRLPKTERAQLAADFLACWEPD
jgi:hypothetical protein